MPIVIGGSSGRAVVSGCAWEPRVTQPETFVEGRREILRQASIALGGRPVTVWEVSARAELEPQASSEPAPTHHTTKLDVDATLRRWNIAIVQGSRWVGCQGAADGFWVVAPVRTRPPAPPPEGRARGALARSERFDAVRVVRSCCTLESRVLKEKKIPLEFDSTLEVVYLNGDPNALYDLLVNLIRNAADASAARPAPIRVGLTQVGNALRLSVRDEGAGIRPQDLDRIFEPGFTTKPFGEGSGMGLVVVQSVVHNMFAGSVAVDSTVGTGTTVTVTLPIPAQRGVDSRSEAPPLAS